MTRDGGSAGFSLVEVLIALAITGMVAVSLSALSSLVLRQEPAMQQLQADEEQLVAAGRLLRQMVSRAVPDVAAAAGVEMGSTVSLTLRSLGPDSLLLDRPVPMTLTAKADGALTRLTFSWTPNGSTEEAVVLVARSASFSYFGRDTDQADSWRSSWSDPEALPQAVLLRVAFDSLGPPVDIIARSTTTLPGVCRALPAEPDCG